MNPTQKADALAPRKHSKVRTWTIVIGSVLLMLAVAYAAGRLQSSAKMERIEAQSERAVETEQQTSSKLQAELEAERAKTLKLEARRRLHLSLLALDERNFGTAQDQLHIAAALLEKSKLEPGSELEKLRSTMAAHKIVATDDLGQERALVLGWAKRLDRVLPPQDP